MFLVKNVVMEEPRNASESRHGRQPKSGKSVYHLSSSMHLFSKLVENRNLLKNLVRRDLKRRYVGSVGGFLWSVIHPLAMLVSYSFVFSIVFRQRLGPQDGTESVPIFLFCGILPWILFTDTVLRSCGVIVENTSLITKTILPAEMLPVAITLSNLVHHAIGLTILFAQGVGWLVAGLQVFLRDTFQALQIVLFLWQWFTPIFYSLDQVPERYRAA